MERANTVPALMLIGIGVVLLVAQLTGVGAEAVVAIIGAGFLIAYAATRTYGLRSWWPAVLIVIGAMILLSQSRTAHPAPGADEGL